jgi:hypothetical protein
MNEHHFLLHRLQKIELNLSSALMKAIILKHTFEPCVDLRLALLPLGAVVNITWLKFKRLRLLIAYGIAS